jgi:hypothetical protein
LRCWVSCAHCVWVSGPPCAALLKLSLSLFVPAAREHSRERHGASGKQQSVQNIIIWGLSPHHAVRLRSSPSGRRLFTTYHHLRSCFDQAAEPAGLAPINSIPIHSTLGLLATSFCRTSRPRCHLSVRAGRLLSPHSSSGCSQCAARSVCAR